jgi:hypothetical protein
MLALPWKSFASPESDREYTAMVSFRFTEFYEVRQEFIANSSLLASVVALYDLNQS